MIADGTLPRIAGAHHERDAPARLDEMFHTADRCPRCRTRAEIIQARLARLGDEIRAGVRYQVQYDEQMDRFAEECADEK